MSVEGILNHRHAFEPIQERTLPTKRKGWGVVNISFSALTATIHRIYAKFSGKVETTPSIVPLEFGLLPVDYHVYLLTFFDLPELAQFSTTAKYPNTLVSDSQIWRSIAARINCRINENSPIPIYKQVLHFIANLQKKAGEIEGRPEDITQILKRPTIDEINRLQNWLQAREALITWRRLFTAFLIGFPNLDVKDPGKIADLKSSQEIIAKASEYSDWLLINQTLLRARDILVVWRELAEAAGLAGPGLADLNTEDAVIEKSREFSDWFNANQNEFSRLRKLDLSCCNLFSLPEKLCNLTQLNFLDLQINQLTALPEQFGKLTELRGLGLSNNQLTALPELLCNLTKLERLFLSNNQLTALPEQFGNLAGRPEFGSLNGLHVLNLSDNQLNALPEQLCKLTNLWDLNLDDNQLTALPEQLCNLTQLVRLSLANNQLNALPEQFGNLTRLRHLILYNNQLIPLPVSFHLMLLRLDVNRFLTFLTNNRDGIGVAIVSTVAVEIYLNRASVMNFLANAVDHLISSYLPNIRLWLPL